MLRAIRRYLARHHVALLALFLALGGTSVAAATFISGARIKPGSLPENRLTPAAAASLKATEAVAYCRAARSRPRSYSIAPCGSRAEAVADGFNVGAVAVGTDGNPLVTFGGHPISLVRCNDPICAGDDESVQEINGTFCGSSIGSDLVVNADGNPFVTHKNGGCANDGVLVVVGCLDPSCAAFNESGHAFDVDGNGGSSSVAIGTDGNPVVSYYDNLPEGDLKVLRCDDHICDGVGDTINVVATAGDVGQHTSLAVGKDGNPVIAFYDATNHDLKVARCNDRACAGGDERISTVDGAGDVGEFASLAIGTNGNPVIAYYKRSTGDLRVARCNDPACTGGNETRSTVSSAGDVGQYASLGIGLDGRPVVAFYDVTRQDVRIARCNDTGCAGGNERIATLDSAGDVGQYAALAIGVDGVPVVAYLDATNNTIKVARPSLP